MRLDIAGETLALTPGGALVWPAESTLFVADLHLGKTAAFRAWGIPLPEGATDETLARLEADLAEARARRLVVLGDLWHAPESLAPLTRERFSAWRARFEGELALVPGNHDRAARPLADELGLIPLPPGTRLGPFSLWHAPPSEEEAGEDAFALAGHLHPVVRLAGRRLRALWLRERGAVLPAYGAFTGGRSVAPGPRERLFALSGRRVYPLGPGPLPKEAPRRERP